MYKVELGRNFLQVRIVLIGLGVATTVLFLFTLFRLLFSPGELPATPVIWLLLYFIDPLLVVFALGRLGATEPAAPQANNPLSFLWMTHIPRDVQRAALRTVKRL